MKKQAIFFGQNLVLPARWLLAAIIPKWLPLFYYQRLTERTQP
jgi:hypothetical protein